MIRIIAVMIVLLFQAGVATAAPLAGDTMIEKVTGMGFIWVPQGCFQPGHLSGATATLPVVKNNTDVVVVHINDIDGEQIHEFNVLDSVADPNAMEPVFIDQAMSRSPGIDTSKLTCLRQGFWMAKYEVTQGQYNTIMAMNPSGFKKGNNYPVEQVSWLDARKFIMRLNKVSGKHFRLPSEAQWEYAARSGGKNHKYGAAGKADNAAWYMNNSGDSSHPVGQKKANALGLYDMSGNVWEWTADCWNQTLTTMPKDGSANKSGNCAARVLRGGSWYDARELIKTTSRLWNDTDKFDNNSGFRLVLD
jgi:formylglycine-generating enzyme required for sulfatase activity